MFRTAPPSDRKPSAIEKAAKLGSPAVKAGGGLVDRHATKGPRRFPYRLNFYDKPPIHEITIEQFETWAIDRLRVLAEIESSHARNRSYAELKDLVNAQSKKYLPLSATTAGLMRGGVDLEGERMKDHVSHFVLRLAFCRTEDLRRRFVKAETTLFRLRFESDDAQERERFLQTLQFEWKSVSQEEKQNNKESLLAATPWLYSTFDSESFFKVHWTRVADLVEKRRVFLQGGTAWVPMREQSSLVVAEFQSRLIKELEMTARALPRLDEDDRLLPVLSHLSMGFLAGVSSDLSTSAITGVDGGHVTADMVDALVKRHAPMCMRNLHETLQDKGHLRHYGRLQYNSFLKDVGLPVEEALLFWRRSFRGMSDDKFNKEYKYNIRYGYGLEGKRINFPAKNCINIITQDQPGPQDNHGCPFRHFSPANLSSALISQYSLNFAEQSEILQAVKSGHYHVGCTRLFEITHRKQGVKKGDGLGEGESVSHPNRYFERSWSLVKDAKSSSTSASSGGGGGGNDDEKDESITDRTASASSKRTSAAAQIDIEDEGDDEDMDLLLQEAQKAEDDAMAVDT